MPSADRVWRSAAVAALGAWLGACAGASPPPPVAVTAHVAPSAELGRSRDVVVVTVQADDTAERLAQRYLGDGRLAWRVSPLSPGSDLRPGGVAVIALRAADYPPARAGEAQAVPILCYHRFTSRPRSGSLMEVTAHDLEAQLDWLARTGHTVVRLEDLQAFLDGEAALPPKAVVLTIDDGYRSAYDVAFPVLRARNRPFTLFIYTDYITGRGDALSWSQLTELQRSGLADLEAHTRSHPDLTRLPPGDARRLDDELAGSRAELQRRIGGGVTALAYPYGAVDARVLEGVRRSGYRAAATVKRGANPSWADPLLLRRDMVLGNMTLAQFARLVDGGATEGA